MKIQDILRQCYDVAKRSPDKSNQNGAALVSPIRYDLILLGWNRFPIGFDVDVNDRSEKLFYIEHAERDVLFRAAKSGISTVGRVLVCPWAACGDCARAIIFSGIQRLIVHKQRMEMTPDRWKANVEKAGRYMIDCGVEIEYFDGKVGGGPILVNGELWYP